MSILNDTTPRFTRHLSDHHAVQGEAEYVERHAPVTASPGWKPIETAPRDGTRVLFWLADEGFPCLASWRKWDGYEGFYLWEMGDFADHNLPTHWMPLPAAPEAEGGSDER